MKKLKILMLAPLTREVSMNTTGGRCRIIYDLAEALIKKGHEVDILGTGDSITNAKIIPIIDKCIYDIKAIENLTYFQFVYSTFYLNKLSEIAKNYDIIHNHFYPLFFPMMQRKKSFQEVPMVTTVHLSLKPETIELLKKFNNEKLIHATKFQSEKTKSFAKQEVVHHAINSDFYKPVFDKGDHFLFFGRMKKYTDEKGNNIDVKGLDVSIRSTILANESLLIAGNCESQNYFDSEISPFLSEKIKFYGEKVTLGGIIGFDEKIKLYQKSKALLFLSQEEETFGMTMIEAMACGTPVIAINGGTAPEIVKDGVTGFLVENNPESIAKAMTKINQIDRNKCREHILQNFDISRMVNDYERIYLHELS